MTIAALQALVTGRATGSANRIQTERDLWSAIINECCKLYEVKEIDVNLTLHPTYITDNFDGTGLGINGMAGFAICNGNNGTFDRTGRTGTGYGTGTENIGTLYGSADAVVVSHKHNFTRTLTGKGTGGVGDFASTASNTDYSDNTETEYAGVSGVGKNIPPSISTLMIQRIA